MLVLVVRLAKGDGPVSCLGWIPAAIAMACACTCASCGPRSVDSREIRPGARFTFDVRDERGRHIPAKITLAAIGGTPELKLANGAIGERRGRMVVAGNKILTLEGSGQIAVPPGIYDVFVSRGIEWTLSITPRVEIGARGYDLHARLDHVIDTTGWLSGDFHVHASPSWDSDVPLATRAIEFVTEGVDLIVSTDHNVVADYAPAIEELDATPLLASMIGDEITTIGWGHFGLYPLPARLVGQHYGAAWRHHTEGREIFAEVRRGSPGTLIQVNHPRSPGGMGYFNDERFDRRSGRSTHGGFSLGFDALELINSSALHRHLEEVLLDWFSLLDHGRVVTATGNSDTHAIGPTLGGYPRNYLRVPDDRPDRVSETEILAAVRGHHTFFTTGPFIQLRSGAAGIGDVVTAKDGKVTLSIEVVAAPWIGVDSVQLYVNGKVEQRWTLQPTQLPVRLETEHTIEVGADSYVVLRADGTEPEWPVAGDNEHYPIYPLAITNPLFIDRDGDGKFTR